MKDDQKNFLFQAELFVEELIDDPNLSARDLIKVARIFNKINDVIWLRIANGSSAEITNILNNILATINKIKVR